MESKSDDRPAPMLSTTDIADRFNVHPITIRREIKRGNVPGARKIGGSWRIPADSPFVTGEEPQAAAA